MWFAILSSSQLKNKPVGLKRLGKDIVLWRDAQKKVNCLEDICVHRKARLSKGKVVNGSLQCPFHGFEYNGDGKVTLIPAYGKNYKVEDRFKVKNYYVFEKFDFIWIWLGEEKPEGEPKFFDDINDSFSFSDYGELWTVPFTRSVENQLDVMHLPFVHHNTIGKGGKTVVNGPVVKWIDQDKFFFYVFNEKEKGVIAKKPEELKIEDSSIYLEFIFPNVWQNHISENVRVVAFFAPVDKESSIVYIRFYMKLSGMKFFDSFVSKVGMVFNRIVLHQDKRVVETEKHNIFDDLLVQGDLPIMEFRKRIVKNRDLFKDFIPS
ncbi:MAG: Rieske (2Fe-2S) domain protein [candidate division TA06 bacterium 32_111]|uniref:Rieske (2Fe-2S) domain protein n=2 Tax=Bacteria candidate phyla TaxID=1783234 RepID=A0A124G0P6_UNCT6|nr:MAG: Rieske (2Fe-2S) domain protein [candidate division TA06 bacterium 32_111]KUK88166.1 MAG: Rieske (2Fe-2S) domain protein [candidate division TA06 bacterium 34_109]HAF07096.1 aromatic ring-hydroxylating dioxygenase subunit alpha [candidate division WOR-3 bacterium]HCP17157.1 aromatic ring-hydroxylating dioxygenase subunit alpha [candidate division WOR-3 bacterium]